MVKADCRDGCSRAALTRFDKGLWDRVSPAIAQLLGLLGQSRIANNLNKLAYQANIGALAMDDHALDQIEEACELVRSMRALLIRALGLKE